MAFRTAYDAVSGTVLTATNLDKYPGGWIGYNEVFTTQTPITGLVDATGLSVTVTVGTGRKIRISGSVGFTSSVTTDIGVVQITDGANVPVQECNVGCNLGLTAQVKANASIVVNPSAGANTWKLRVARGSGGSGTMSVNAGSTSPNYIIVEDIGPAA